MDISSISEISQVSNASMAVASEVQIYSSNLSELPGLYDSVEIKIDLNSNPEDFETPKNYSGLPQIVERLFGTFELKGIPRQGPILRDSMLEEYENMAASLTFDEFTGGCPGVYGPKLQDLYSQSSQTQKLLKNPPVLTPEELSTRKEVRQYQAGLRDLLGKFRKGTQDFFVKIPNGCLRFDAKQKRIYIDAVEQIRQEIQTALDEQDNEKQGVSYEKNTDILVVKRQFQVIYKYLAADAPLYNGAEYSIPELISKQDFAFARRVYPFVERMVHVAQKDEFTGTILEEDDKDVGKLKYKIEGDVLSVCLDQFLKKVALTNEIQEVKLELNQRFFAENALRRANFIGKDLTAEEFLYLQFRIASARYSRDSGETVLFIR